MIISEDDRMATTTDVAAKEGTVIEPKPHDRFVANLKARAVAAQGDDGKKRSFEIAASQMDKILTAETEEDIWDADEGGTVSGKDFTDIAIEINGYELTESDDKYDSPLGVYVNINATTLQKAKGYDVGEIVIINTGATLIITKLEAFRSKGLIPGLRCIIKGTEAKNGTVLKLRPLASVATPA
jgi:hypothetical protein